MSTFAPIKFTFDGKTKTVEPENVLPLIARVEDVLTLGELVEAKAPPLAKLSRAYGICLRYAGFVVTDDEIYLSMFQKQTASVIAAAVQSLQQMMIPPKAIQEAISDSEGDDEEKKGEADPVSPAS